MDSLPSVHSGNRLSQHWGTVAGGGFTVVEMIIVMAIIAGLVGLTATGMENMVRSYNIGRTLTSIEKILEIGREEAVTKRTYVWVGIKEDTRPVQIGALASLNGDPSNTSSSNLRSLVRVLQLSGNDILSFSVVPNPSVGTTDMVSIPLTSGSNSTYSFVFTPQGQVVMAKTINAATPSVDDVALNLTFQKGIQAQICIKGGNGDITDNWNTR